MDRSLDDIVAERQRANPRPRRGPPPPRRGNNDYPRDGVRKVKHMRYEIEDFQNRSRTVTYDDQPRRDERPDLDNDWMHDRYDDEPSASTSTHGGFPSAGSRRNDYPRERASPERERATPPAAKLRVDNLHYDLTEDDIYDLFTRIAPIENASLRYDRAGRSEGIAFVTYAHVADARTAIREFDGANAKGQPIRITLMPIGPTALRGGGGGAAPTARRDNPFDKVENPKSLFDRIEAPTGRSRRRSDSPASERDGEDRRDSRRRPPPRQPAAAGPRDRRSDVSGPPPENIDRYVPGQSNGRSPRRPPTGRRPGERREREPREPRGRGEGGPRMANGRPRKTAEELDAEMEDYWGSSNTAPGHEASASDTPGVAPAAVEKDEDIDMIE